MFKNTDLKIIQINKFKNNSNILSSMEISYVPCYSKTKLDKKFVNKIKSKFKSKNTVVFSTIQYLKQTEELVKELGFKFGGQVLGCRIPNKKADKYLYIGTGEFHALAIGKKYNKPVWIANPETKELDLICKKRIESIEKREIILTHKVLEARKIGIFVSIKSGQYNMKQALELKNKLKDKEVYIFLGDMFNSNEILNFEIDAWINTACPRIIEDYKSFEKPITNYELIKEALK